MPIGKERLRRLTMRRSIGVMARELTGFMWDIALAAQSSFSQQKQN
ncbi:transposase [Escherichia coli]|nr:transposase [Escherichia coli]